MFKGSNGWKAPPNPNPYPNPKPETEPEIEPEPHSTLALTRTLAINLLEDDVKTEGELCLSIML
jgi:hypothetical protein